MHTPGFLSATLSLDYRTPNTQPFLLHGYTQTHNFEGISPLWPPLLGKEMKLFFFISPKTLSPRFNSVLGYRGQLQLQYHSGDIKVWGILLPVLGLRFHVRAFSSWDKRRLLFIEMHGLSSLFLLQSMGSRLRGLQSF